MSTESSIVIDQAPPLKSEIQVYVYPAFDQNKCFSKSFDPECQALLTYLFFTDANWSISVSDNPQISPSGEFPFLTDELDIVETGFRNSIKYLKNLGYDLDALLSGKETAVSLALQSVIRDRFKDVLNYEWFMLQENYYASIRPELFGLFGYFSGYINIHRIRAKALKRISLRDWKLPYNPGKKHKSPLNFPWTKAAEDKQVDSQQLASKIINERRNKVYECAKQCLSMLETQLGDRPFFMGNSVTTLDTVAYGYLSLAVNMDMKKPALKTLISLKYPTLLEFVDRMNSILRGTQNLSEVASSNASKSILHKPKSQPLAYYPPEPSSVLDFVKAMTELTLPNLYKNVTIFKEAAKSALEIIMGKRNTPTYKTQHLNPNNTVFDTAQFLLGSAFFVLGFISTKRILYTNIDNLSEDYFDDSNEYMDDEYIYDIQSSKDILGNFQTFEPPSSNETVDEDEVEGIDLDYESD